MKKKTIWDLQRVTLEEYRSEGKLPLVVVLDNIRSLNNIGSIFRTSDAFRVERLLLCGITATPPSIEIHKTALGAEDSVAWEYHEDALTAVEGLKNEGYTVCCLEQVHDSIELQDFVVESERRYAIVAGHEVDGVDPRVVDACHYAIEIPQEGTKHSLNVAVSTGIALWHFFSHLRP
ncbi:MAG: RNA methyltransferase [Bacteroidales bacterium]|nr:RNA methyltransferase [Bacteroidales bacterium]